MSAIKERILGAVTVMNENDAQTLWNLIIQKFGTSWENVEKVSPDDWDLHKNRDSFKFCLLQKFQAPI